MQHIFNLNDPEIKHLKNGEFAIPLLNYELIPEVIGGEKSIKTMAKDMQENGQYDLILEVNEKINSTLNTSNVFNLIKDEYKLFKIKPTPEKAEKIFHLIQLWGGQAGRMFYFKNTKLDKELYLESVNIFLDSNNLEEILIQLKKLINNTPEFNISFATKHVSIWQGLEITSKLKLSIYDNVMASNIMGRFYKNKNGALVGKTYNDFKYLKIFWEKMNLVSKELNVSTLSIERNLFNFFRGGTPDSWPRFKYEN